MRRNVEAIERMVEAVRRRFSRKRRRAFTQLPGWPGKVIEPLTRDKIYEDCGRVVSRRAGMGKKSRS